MLRVLSSREDVNTFSIGIELVGFATRAYTAVQLDAVVKLLQHLVSQVSGHHARADCWAPKYCNPSRAEERPGTAVSVGRPPCAGPYYKARGDRLNTSVTIGGVPIAVEI